MSLLLGGFILSLVSTAIEVKLLHNPRFTGFGEWVSKSSMRSMFVSISISYLIGMVFGAAGVLLAVAAMFSTIISYPIHRFIVARRQNAVFNHKVETIKSRAKSAWHTWRWVFTGIKYAALVLTSPFWLPVYIHERMTGKPA